MKTTMEIKEALEELIEQFEDDEEANTSAGRYYKSKGFSDMALIATSKATTWSKAAYDLMELVESIEA